MTIDKRSYAEWLKEYERNIQNLDNEYEVIFDNEGEPVARRRGFILKTEEEEKSGFNNYDYFN